MQSEFNATAGDVAKRFGISEQAAYRLAREQRLPIGSFVYLNGRTVRFNLAAIEEWIQAGGADTPPQARRKAA